MAVQLETREVVVEAVNDRGFKAQGEWFNYSKYADDRDITAPARAGERLVVTLDRSGFVRKVEPITAPAKVLDPRELVSTMKLTPPPAPAETVVLPSSIEQDSRGVVITRLACLNTATAILSSGGGATTLDEVIEMAARLEVWATR